VQGSNTYVKNVKGQDCCSISGREVRIVPARGTEKQLLEGPVLAFDRCVVITGDQKNTSKLLRQLFKKNGIPRKVISYMAPDWQKRILDAMNTATGFVMVGPKELQHGHSFKNLPVITACKLTGAAEGARVFTRGMRGDSTVALGIMLQCDGSDNLDSLKTLCKEVSGFKMLEPLDCQDADGWKKVIQETLDADDKATKSTLPRETPDADK
jgi:hypothetical protein